METRDIVERLRDGGAVRAPFSRATPLWPGDDMLEAAAELTRLRAEVERLRELADATDHFFKVAMPKMNIRESWLDSEAIVAWNKLGIAVEQYCARKALEGGE